MKRTTLGIFFALTAGLTVSLASPAEAQTTTHFSPLNCFTVDSSGFKTSQELIYDYQQGYVRRPTTGPRRTLVCPIETQQFSSSSIFVSVRGMNATTADMPCYFRTMDVYGNQNSSSTMLFQAGVGTATRYAFINTSSLSSVEVTLYCTSNPGHEIRRIQLTEYP